MGSCTRKPPASGDGADVTTPPPSTQPTMALAPFSHSPIPLPGPAGKPGSYPHAPGCCTLGQVEDELPEGGEGWISQVVPTVGVHCSH